MLFEPETGPDSLIAYPAESAETISAEEKAQLDLWNETGRPYPQQRVDQLFSEQARRIPQQVAITSANKSLTYQALHDQMNQLAGHLKIAGVGPSSIVGICMNRSIEMVVALLAVFKAGGTYLPLDPAFPADRLTFMQEDARPCAVITQLDLSTTLAFQTSHLLVIENLTLDTTSDLGIQNTPDEEASLDDFAYLLYTSGSTGRPKGVRISHRALTNILTTVAADVQLTSSEVFLAVTTISFDISAFEIFAPLISGAQLVLASHSVASDGVKLAAAIQSCQATFLQATPSGWRILVESGWTGHDGLKMLSAGEPMDRTLATRLLERGAELWNLYGPTEAAIYATACRVDRYSRARITIGKPLSNYSAYILTKDKRRVAIGATGELYLGGVGVADGYLNRAELSAERFIPNCFAEGESQTLYRTGDLAKFLPSGDIDCVGRVDNQIKLRGYRIELEEIESALDSHDSVGRSIVQLSHVNEDDERLIAYIVPLDHQPINERELREHLFRSLPAYMVPSAFIPVEAFQLTPNGKIDRKALPAFEFSRSAVADTTSDSESPGMQQILREGWKSALNIKSFADTDSFYDLGGHSLIAVRLVADLERRLGRKILVSSLVETPTFNDFAKRICDPPESESDCLVTMQREGALQPLFLIHHRLGDILVYRELANCFAPHRPVFGIQAPADFLGRQHPYPLTALASEYVKEVLNQQPSGPIYLAGYSSGAVLAFEMARQLTELGKQIGLLALIDGEIANPQPKPSSVAQLSKSLLRKIYKIILKFRDEIADGPKNLVMSRVRHYKLLSRIRDMEQPSNSAAHMQTLISQTVEQALLLSENAYRPKPYEGRATLVRFRNEAWRLGPDPLMGWETLVQGGITTFDLPGGHITGMNASRALQLFKILQSEIEANTAASLKLP